MFSPEMFQHLAAQTAAQWAKFMLLSVISPPQTSHCIHRTKFLLCYGVSPAPVSPAERQRLPREMRWEEKIQP